ncbi:phosphoglycerate dehydrogenase [Aeromonas hydrophila]|uniref:phosphoglycerate dehydrogenase n=1 Tax=Aeromonas hydrophila TaxID=644 RepID=UPI000F536376|nr:phosphoglycerate dehydrogenase [Aeromonas hydrophila]RQM71723.1 hydroxyacid dehydrogenase [Aeromonas hydrophila]WGY32427.1 phosphoglycerate dehydrogenase [Aeromonas hydrophila]HDC4323214.1 phosphoglycerate dehydrogenase [Aeromonas hydrophila]
MKIAITSKAFSQNSQLIELISQKFPDYKLNLSGTKLNEDELIDFISDCDGVILALEYISDRVLSKSPKLRVISKFGVGTDNIDFKACERYGIKVFCHPGVNRHSVAELTLCMFIMLIRNVFTSAVKLSNGVWLKQGGHSLYGKTIGIIGCGNVGVELIRLLSPFGCRIMINDILDRRLICQQYSVEQVDLSTILTEADIVSLHVPLSSETRNMVNSDFIKKMKRNSLLINTSRGEIVDLMALKSALLENIISGAAIDVYPVEPPTDLQFLALPNLIPTPHIGGNSREATIEMGVSAINSLCKYFYIDEN